MSSTEAAYYASLIAGCIADEKTRADAARAVIGEVVSMLQGLKNDNVGIVREGETTLVTARRRGLALTVTDGEPRIHYAERDAFGRFSRIDWEKPIALSLVFDGAHWVSRSPDPFVAPEPGQPIPRRSGAAVILEKLFEIVSSTSPPTVA